MIQIWKTTFTYLSQMSYLAIILGSTQLHYLHSWEKRPSHALNLTWTSKMTARLLLMIRIKYTRTGGLHQWIIEASLNLWVCLITSTLKASFIENLEEKRKASSTTCPRIPLLSLKSVRMVIVDICYRLYIHTYTNII